MKIKLQRVAVVFNFMNREYGFVSKNKECYYNYFYGDYDTLINWSKYRIYTLMDIHNSPMRRIVEESLKQSKI